MTDSHLESTTSSELHTIGITPTGDTGSTADAGPEPTIVAEPASPVVLRDDRKPVHFLRSWRRAGRAEGRRKESHPVRALTMLAALGALAYWLPGAAVFLGILSFLVLIHEGGHYLVARQVGMRPTEFFIGFGPTIWSRTAADGLRYGIKAIPAGGYVQVPGMGPREEVEASLEPYTYRAATRPRRLAFILAGVAVNLVFAVAIFSLYAMVATPADGSPPERNPLVAVGRGAAVTGEVMGATVDGLGRQVLDIGGYAGSIKAGEVPENRMISPVGGAQLTDGILSTDPSKLLLLTGLFSASIALFNVLPLLPLDGGHALLVAIEAAVARVRRRPQVRLDPNRFTPVAVVVLVALLALSATSAYLDVLHPLSIG